MKRAEQVIRASRYSIEEFHRTRDEMRARLLESKIRLAMRKLQRLMSQASDS